MVDIQGSYGKELKEAADKLGTFLDWWDTINPEAYSKKYPQVDIEGTLSTLHGRLNKYCSHSDVAAGANFQKALHNLSKASTNMDSNNAMQAQAGQKLTKNGCDRCGQVFCACDYLTSGTKSQENQNLSQLMNNLTASNANQSNANKGNFADKKKPMFHRNMNPNALKSDDIDFVEKIRIMWTIVRQTEGNDWSKEHIRRNANKFDCKLCDCVLATPYDVVKHVQGKKHKDEVQDDGDDRRLQNDDLNASEKMALAWQVVIRLKEAKNIVIGGDKRATCSKCGTTMQMKQIVGHLKGKRHNE